MDATEAYVIVWACAFATVLIYKCPERLLKPVLQFFEWSRFYQGARIARRIPFHTLYEWDGQRITICHYLVLFSYALGNGLLFARPAWSSGFHIVRASREEVRRRAAVAASINLVPVVLGGRTCLVLDSFNISLQHYYFAHHWLARLATVQMTMHAALHLGANPAWNTQTTCGLIVLLPPSIEEARDTLTVRSGDDTAIPTCRNVRFVGSTTPRGPVLLHSRLTRYFGTCPITLSLLASPTSRDITRGQGPPYCCRSHLALRRDVPLLAVTKSTCDRNDHP